MTAVWEIQDEPEVRAKVRGQARAESAHYRDVQLAREIARELYLAAGLPISADDVRVRMLARFPDTIFGNWMGSVFRGSEWRAVGFVNSKTTGSHANLLRTWALRKGESTHG